LLRNIVLVHGGEAVGARAVRHRLINFKLPFIEIFASDNSLIMIEPD
jgi:hypothetical protein